MIKVGDTLPGVTLSEYLRRQALGRALPARAVDQ